MRAETKIGLLILAALGVLLYFLVKMGSLSSIFEPRGYEIKAYFQSIAGLEERAPVRLAGVKIGYVERIDLREGRALVIMKIYEKYRIRKGSKAAVTSMGIMGEKYIEIFPGEEEGYLPPKSTIEGIPPLSIDQLGAMFYSIAQDVKKMSKTFSEVIGGEKGRASLNTILENLDRITTRLDALLKENGKNITLASTQILSTLRELKKAIREFSIASEKIADLSYGVNQKIPMAQKAMENFSETSKRLASLSMRLEKQLNTLDRGPVGRAIRDESLYENAKEILEETSRMVKALRGKIQSPISLTPYLFYSSEGMGKAGVRINSSSRWLTVGLTREEDRTSYDLLLGEKIGAFSLSAGMIEGEFGLRGKINPARNLFIGAEIYRPKNWKYRLLFGMEKRGLLFFAGYGGRKNLLFGAAVGF